MGPFEGSQWKSLRAYGKVAQADFWPGSTKLFHKPRNFSIPGKVPRGGAGTIDGVWENYTGAKGPGGNFFGLRI